MTSRIPALAFLLVALSLPAGAFGLELHRGDHIAFIGNTLADRMQHHGWLETYIHALHPGHDLTFRNLAFPADEITTRLRSANFGSPDQWLTKVEADVVFCFFGRNEALRGRDALPAFRRDLAAMIDGMRAQKYNGESAPRLVIFSPTAHEDLHSPHLPDGRENNRKLELYTRAMREVCREKGVTFVDLFTPTLRLYADAARPLTLNGVHFLEHGNRALARVIVRALFGPAAERVLRRPDAELEPLRQAVLDKNEYWFSRYRVVDGYNVYGGRSRLAWFGQSNADVMRREMEIFDIMTANRDRRVWAVARGSDIEVDDSNIPPLLKVRTNKPGPLEDGSYPYLGGKEAIGRMKVAKGMQVNLFASEEMFPEVVNPVQMAVDTDSRLFVSVWPSYPHWNPTEPRRDRIICLPDEDRDGVADHCLVFADELNSITGFEFWGGGMLVAAPPEIWFLKDTDGDDRADVKIRMLQGVSSADTHHTANAFVFGPDGWLYWSRGIFNTASMETPTGIYRSTQAGVHRFNPLTFEVQFHFPIGPNPHGDVFDQWGYQFANDGTSGTGSYVDIGKGIGNKHWFRKRVRPVAATGILSSSHFPEHNNGNFLICNTITVLGVLQHEIHYNGADITAVEIEPIVVSSDPNFRPVDVEIGGDGALYIADWCNALIGHMQHNMRDPNRDHKHGRIYRVTCKGRPLLEPVKLKGKPIEEVCRAFFAKENGTRYRARIELTGRPAAEVTRVVSAWAGRLDPARADEAQALLECLWVFEQHRVPNMKLLRTVFKAAEPRVRAAAIRTLGHWAGRVEGWEPILTAAARDQSALVRAEAAKAAVDLGGLAAAEAIFEIATRPTDPELDRVLDYARGALKVDAIVADAVRSGKPLSAAAQAYVLQKASVEDLLKLERTEAVYRAILGRENVPLEHLRESLDGLAALRKESPVDLLLELVDERVAAGRPGGLADLGRLLVEQRASELARVQSRIEELAAKGPAPEVRRLGYAAWIVAAGSTDDAFLAASRTKEGLREFLEAVPMAAPAAGDALRRELYAKVRPLISELPANLTAEADGAVLQQHGIRVDYYQPSASNVARETLERMTPRASGVVPAITMNVPQRKAADRFALRFTGVIQVPRSGRYTFYTRSDDGSRIYVGDRLVVDNDGLHGMVEKSGAIDLPAGGHPIVVTYFDNGGGDGLQVSWKGPGFARQKIAPDRLTVSGGENLHDIAIRALSAIPVRERDRFTALAALIKAGRHRASAVHALAAIPEEHWPAAEIPSLVDNLVGYVSEFPARFRTGPPATEALALARSLARKLPAAQAKAVAERLENLDVRVIAIGTVPHRMIFDKERIAVQAGKPVEFRFSNTDEMPHNFSITEPGALEEVGLLGEATANDPDAAARQYIPRTDKILLASRLLDPGQTQALSFDVPAEPAVYPYVCTYPGHWRRMYGALLVVADLEAYQADPAAYLAAHPLEIKDELLEYNTRGREWTFDELIDDASPLPPGRNFDVGKQLFRVSSCISCHRLDGEGQVFGPDLAKLDAKKRTVEHILRSMLEPSKDIDEKYRSHVFVLKTGKIVSGMIVEQNAGEIHVVVDPLAKNKPTVIARRDIVSQTVSNTSIMPVGLLNKLTREEILDLVAFVLAGGDRKNELFHGQHEH